MPGFEALGRTLLVIGVITALLGLGLMTASRLHWVGRLPGDIVVHRGSFSFYFPIVTFLLISILLTILVNVLIRWLSH